MNKVAFVTGASAGIGEATAHELLAAGYTVFAGARRLERMAGLAALGASKPIQPSFESCSPIRW